MFNFFNFLGKERVKIMIEDPTTIKINELNDNDFYTPTKNYLDIINILKKINNILKIF